MADKALTNAIARADLHRIDARRYQKQADAALRQAQEIEAIWDIPAPCEGTTTYCGKRDCEEH